jgi:predicted permease
VHVYETMDTGGRNSVSGGAYLDWRTHSTRLDSVTLTAPTTANLRRGRGTADRLSGLEVSHEFLRVFGVAPILGRGFGPDDDRPGGRNDVVLLSEGLWRSRFASDPALVGGTITLDERPRTVIGIVPDGAWIDGKAQFLVPAVLEPGDRGERKGHWAEVFGRMKPGVTLAELDAELKAIKRELNPSYPAFKQAWGVAAAGLQDELAAEARPLLIALTVAVLLVLLIACANIANLLLARAWMREREVALRAALGAAAGRLVRQLLTESALLALIGGLAGVGLAALSIDVLASWTVDFLPVAMAPRLDVRVVLFALGTSVLTGFLFGVLPAWRARRPNLMETLRRDGPTATARRHRAQSVLVVCQVALTVVLLVSAGLFGRSLVRAVNADPGFTPARALAFDLSLPDATYPTKESRLTYSHELLTRLRALPGVRAAGTAMGVPFAGGGFGEFLTGSAKPRREEMVIGRVDYVSDGLLEALGARLVEGRFFTADENRPGARRLAVINQTAARLFFPNTSPVGRNIYFNDPFEVIGVVADVVDRRLDLAQMPRLYTVQARNPFQFSIVVGATGDPARLGSDVARVMRTLDAGVSPVNVRALDDAMARSMSDRRLVSSIVLLFAAAALGLASLGVYGVMADAVSARRRELCLRIALGAGRGEVIRSVVTGGLALAAIGLGVGAAGAAAASRLLQQLLFDVRPSDPLVFGGAMATIAVVALLASCGPALRATRLDAIAALRD